MILNIYHFFLNELCFFIQKRKIILTAATWFFYFKIKNLKKIKALWKHEYKQIFFGKADRNLLILAVRSKSTMLLRFILSKYNYEGRLKHPRVAGLMTFFQYAVSCQNKVIVEEILSRTSKKFMDKMINDQFGSAKFSPLHIAAYYGDLEMVKLLCKYGARYCPRDKDNKTPADLARSGINQDLISFFNRLNFVFEESEKGNFIDLSEYDGDKDEEKLSLWNAQNEHGFSVSDYYLDIVI